MGCGTGAEQEGGPAPRARVTAVDVSQEMLRRLEQKMSRHRDQLTLVRGSYMDFSYPHTAYDYVVHHDHAPPCVLHQAPSLRKHQGSP
ncbi:MAG: class I SAM-dependent methyltransferase [Bacillota bacterium]